jgi:adenine-specific DNA-methyltransferase
MKGHVPTPDGLAEEMIGRLFDDEPPQENDRILYPGCGTGPFAAAVERFCEAENHPFPSGVGVDTDPQHLDVARDRELEHARFERCDYLADDMLDIGTVDYIVGNPPYVPIEGLDEGEKRRYKAGFSTAVGRFDLYLLFFERSVELLEQGGVLSFVTPEKFEYVDTAAPLRRLLSATDVHVETIDHLDEDMFDDLVTFPCVTTVRRKRRDETRILLRDGSTHTALLPQDGESWAASVRVTDTGGMETEATLGDATVRISAGMATGADALFVMNRNEVPPQLAPDWIRPTVSGRQLTANDGPQTDSVLVCPYRTDGSLPDESELGAFGQWAELHRDRLEDRSCVDNGKPWYSWHETPPMDDLLRSKIVFKDIAKRPRFWAENDGTVVPRHSVYYLVPKSGVPFDELLDYLNGPDARRWMNAHCQKAANGFIRLQSRVLRDLPVPRELCGTYQETL